MPTLRRKLKQIRHKINHMRRFRAMKLKNFWLVLKDQLPITRLLRNLYTGRILGLTHLRSHYNKDGRPKVAYRTKETAIKSALAMSRKHSVFFSNYKCLYCDGYHVGKSSPIRPYKEEHDEV